MTRVTRKFWWDGDTRWIVYCAGAQLVWISQYDEHFEVKAA